MPSSIPSQSLFPPEYVLNPFREVRSLYELDLKTRLFRYQASPLLHSRMVQNLPAELKQWLFQRLNAVLTGREEMHESYLLPDGNRTETLEVLRATVPDWPKE